LRLALAPPIGLAPQETARPIGTSFGLANLELSKGLPGQLTLVAERGGRGGLVLAPGGSKAGPARIGWLCQVANRNRSRGVVLERFPAEFGAEAATNVDVAGLKMY
jgi:hypothetical protein